jgi:hypothetical protein
LGDHEVPVRVDLATADRDVGGVAHDARTGLSGRRCAGALLGAAPPAVGVGFVLRGTAATTGQGQRAQRSGDQHSPPADRIRRRLSREFGVPIPDINMPAAIHACSTVDPPV